jgi:hypothetical protein
VAEAGLPEAPQCKKYHNVSYPNGDKISLLKKPETYVNVMSIITGNETITHAYPRQNSNLRLHKKKKTL